MTRIDEDLLEELKGIKQLGGHKRISDVIRKIIEFWRVHNG